MFSSKFFTTVAVCSVISALTTVGLIVLPKLYPTPGTVEEQVALLHNGWYVARSYIYFVHPFFVLAAALGVAVRKFSTNAGSVIPGFLGFLLWAMSEAAQQALTLIANNATWKAGFAAATNEATKTVLRNQITAFMAIWDGLFFLLLWGFAIANLCYSITLWKSRGLEKVLSIMFFLASFMTVSSILTNYFGMTWLDSVMEWLYPPVQPLARTLIGVWLWKTGDIFITARYPEAQSRDGEFIHTVGYSAVKG